MVASEISTLETAGRCPAFLISAAIAMSVALSCAFALIVGTQMTGRQKLAHQVLVDYQKWKLAGPVGDVVFVGDSSLGTAINANLWQSLTGKTATNFALTGAYGYAGTLEMLEAILEDHAPTDVVIFQTADMMMRAPKETVPSMSSKRASFLHRVSELWLDSMNLDELKASIDYVKKIAGGKTPDTDNSVIENDYVLQTNRKAIMPEPGKFDPLLVNDANLLNLNRIATVCRERSLTCIYMHGPLASPFCEQRTYFDSVNSMIRSSGLALAAEHSLCLSPEQLGNTYDHTATTKKDEMTQRVAEIVRPFLSKPASSMSAPAAN